MPRVPPTYRPSRGQMPPATPPLRQPGRATDVRLLLLMVLAFPAVFRGREWTGPWLLHPSTRRKIGHREYAVLRLLAAPALVAYTAWWWLLALAFPHLTAPPREPLRWYWHTSWTRCRLYRPIFILFLLPLRALGPVILDGRRLSPLARWYAGRYAALWGEMYGERLRLGPAVPPERNRWEWTPGIAHFPVPQAYTTDGETTTTADPGTSGTSLAVTSRTSFPQTAGTQFDILVQNAETDKTNREIMLVTGGHGTGAGSFTVTRGRPGGSAGVAHLIGSYVAQTLTAEGFKNALLNAVGFYNVKDQYGAKGDYGSDDLVPVNNAIAAIGSVAGFGRGGTVLFPEGSYGLSAAPTMTTTTHNGAYKAVTFRGQGKEQTILRRWTGYQGVLFDISGTIDVSNNITTRVETKVVGISFVGHNGADMGAGAPLVRGFYCTQDRFEACHFHLNNGPAFTGVWFQDSRFTDCWFNYCNGSTASNINGTVVGTETVRLLGKDDNVTTGTFGYSIEASNNVWFTDNEFTSGNATQAGVIYFGQNGGSNQPHRSFFTHNKIEGDPYASSVVKFWNARWLRMTNADFSGYAAGAAPVSWIDGNNSDSCSFRGIVFDDSQTAAVTHAAFKLTTCTFWTFEDVVLNFGTAGAGDTTAAVLAEFVGTANDQIYINNYEIIAGARSTPFTTGTLPTNYFTTVRTLVLRTTADQLLAGTGVQSITGLSFASSANKNWFIQATVFVNNTAGDVGGIKLAISVPAGATVKLLAFGAAASATAFTSALITASGTLTGVAFDTVAATPSWVQIQGTVQIGSTAGTIQLQAAEGTAADDITVQANSNLWAQQV